jgi:dTDP-4-dehydrorhamnose 3,5-epimerase
MKITDVKSLAIADVKVIKFGRFNDDRGYFTEVFRNSDFQHHPGMSVMNGIKFLQINEAYSKAETVRGLHFQWNPYMGKLVRAIKGKIIDVGLDIRKGSPNFGKIVGYELSADQSSGDNEWIWIPPGFAHGVVVIEESLVEYLCSGEYSPGCEASISPLAKDIDWSLCDNKLKKTYDSIVSTTKLMTEKDKNGHTLASWKASKDSDNFIYGKR